MSILVFMWYIRTRIPSKLNNEGVHSNVVTSTAKSGQAKAEPMIECVKLPFVDG